MQNEVKPSFGEGSEKQAKARFFMGLVLAVIIMFKLQMHE